MHPNGQFVFVANAIDVTVFSINASTGVLTAVGSPVPTGLSSNTKTLTINTAGTLLYVTDSGSNTTSTFSINAGTGSLTSLGAAVATGSEPEGIAVTP